MADRPRTVEGPAVHDGINGEERPAASSGAGPVGRVEVLARVLSGQTSDLEACRELGLTALELARWKVHTLEAMELADPRGATPATPAAATSELRLVPSASTPTVEEPVAAEPATTGPNAMRAPRLVTAAALGVLAFAASLAVVLPGDVGGLEVVAVLARWAMYAATLLAAGGVLFLWWVHDGNADEPEVDAIGRVVGTAAVAGGIATILGLAIHGTTLAGTGVAGLVDPSNLVAAGSGAVGASLLLRVGGLAYVVYGIRGFDRPSTRVVALAGALLALASFLFVGHTAASDASVFTMVSNVVHSTAGAGWFGGLVLLTVTMRHRRRTDDLDGATLIVQRFSRFAMGSVAVLVVAGVVLALGQLPGLGALFTSRYGTMIVAKVLLVGVVLAVAARNHRSLVPAMVEDGDRAAWRGLRRTVGIEVGGVVLVLLATALLVNLSPPA